MNDEPFTSLSREIQGTISVPAHRLIQNVEHQTFSEAAGVVSIARIGRLLPNSLHFSLEEWPKPPFIARVKRLSSSKCSLQARLFFPSREGTHGGLPAAKMLVLIYPLSARGLA